MIIRPYRAADDEELLMAAELPKGTITRVKIAFKALRHAQGHEYKSDGLF